MEIQETFEKISEKIEPYFGLRKVLKIRRSWKILKKF